MSDQPKRIQRKRTKGYRLPQRATCVAGNAWRNPFETVTEFKTMMTLIDDAKGEIEAVLPHMHRMLWIYNNVHLLKGFDLACWCSLDADCHADVLLEYANRKHSTKRMNDEKLPHTTR